MSPVEGGVVQSKLIRNPGLRARVSVTLVGVALVSVLLLSTVNFVFARLLIKDSVESQLTAVRDTRVQALEIGVERLRSRVSSLAIDPSVAEALVDLSREFSNLNEDLSNDQVENLTALYDAEVVPPVRQGRSRYRLIRTGSRFSGWPFCPTPVYQREPERIRRTQSTR